MANNRGNDRQTGPLISAGPSFENPFRASLHAATIPPRPSNNAFRFDVRYCLTQILPVKFDFNISLPLPALSRRAHRSLLLRSNFENRHSNGSMFPTLFFFFPPSFLFPTNDASFLGIKGRAGGKTREKTNCSRKIFSYAKPVLWGERQAP